MSSASPEEQQAASPELSKVDTLMQTVQIKAARFYIALNAKGLGLIAALIGVAWIFSGIYKVQPEEQGVVLRFGKWIETTESGLHYHLPYPFDTVLFRK